VREHPYSRVAMPRQDALIGATRARRWRSQRSYIHMWSTPMRHAQCGM